MGIQIESRTAKRVVALVASVAMVASLSFPALAFAEVKVDETVLNQGENAVGGGTATLADSVLDMVNVVAENMTVTDEKLTVNFNGGNDIEDVVVDGSSDVTMNFANENDVEDVAVKGDSTLTVNADGHDDLEELDASDNANLIVNVTGENNFEEIVGTGNANITVRGTDCQMKDIVNIEDDEKALLRVEKGNLTIDHVTVNLKGSERNFAGSSRGNVIVDTSKIAAEGSAWTTITAGGAMQISESVIEIAGELFAQGLMTIEHSDVKASKPETAKNVPPYRVYSLAGIKLINEKNGEVKEGLINGHKVWFVDTDDNDGSDVDLKADGTPGYYKCKSTKGMPQTGDGDLRPTFAMLSIISLAIAAYAGRRRDNGAA